MRLRLKMGFASWSAFSCTWALCSTAPSAQTALPQVAVECAQPVGPARFERWRRHMDYFRAALRTPMSMREKLRTLMLAAHHAGRDVVAGARKLAQRSVGIGRKQANA